MVRAMGSGLQAPLNGFLKGSIADAILDIEPDCVSRHLALSGDLSHNLCQNPLAFSHGTSL